MQAQQYQKQQGKIIVILRPCERTIRKEKQATSIDNNPNPSTDSCELPPVDTSTQISIHIRSRDMVVTLVLVRNENGDMHDQEGHLRNAAGQMLDDQRAVIPDHDADAAAANAQAVGDEAQAARPKTLADYNRPDQYYARDLLFVLHLFKGTISS